MLSKILMFCGLAAFVVVVAFIQGVILLTRDRRRIESNKGKTEGDE